MCLAVPMKVIELLPSERAIVEADGISMEISLNLLKDVSVGDYVIVHTGFALELIDQVEAEKTLDLFREIASIRENNPDI
ncbi:HypC/HybG/HupF family hydrogenase formation chaperone [Candidatus Latescibacterota bacterium]